MKLRSLGDTVLMTAPLLELRQAFPEAEIQVAVQSPWASLLENHPGVNRIWTYERHNDTPSRAKALARLALKFRAERFDCAVNFHASPSSATLAFATGAKVRSINFHGHRDKNRHSTVEVPGKGVLKPIIERDMDTVRALGVHVPAGRLPRIFLRNTEREQANARLAQLGVSGRVLTLGLGASRPTKTWPLTRFAATAISWIKDTGGSAVAVTSQAEQELARDFLKAVDDHLVQETSEVQTRANLRKRVTCLSGLGLRELAAVLAGSSALVGNDSGPRHLAVAVGTPTVTVFGPEHPFEWHPYPQETHPYLFIEGLACRKDALPGMPAWCGLHHCKEEQHRCMEQIGVRAVLSQCERVARR